MRSSRSATPWSRRGPTTSKPMRASSRESATPSNWPTPRRCAPTPRSSWRSVSSKSVARALRSGVRSPRDSEDHGPGPTREAVVSHSGPDRPWRRDRARCRRPARMACRVEDQPGGARLVAQAGDGDCRSRRRVPRLAQLRRHAPAVGRGERRPSVHLRVRRHGAGAAGSHGETRRRPGHPRLPQRERRHPGARRRGARHRRAPAGRRARVGAPAVASRRGLRLAERGRDQVGAELFGGSPAHLAARQAVGHDVAGQRLRDASTLRRRSGHPHDRPRRVRASGGLHRIGRRPRHDPHDLRRSRERLRTSGAGNRRQCPRHRDGQGPLGADLPALSRRRSRDAHGARRDRHPGSKAPDPREHDRAGAHRGRRAGQGSRDASRLGVDHRLEGGGLHRRRRGRPPDEAEDPGRGGERPLRGAVDQGRHPRGDGRVGDARRGRSRGHPPGPLRRDVLEGGGEERRGPQEGGASMTGLALRNPIAILMLCVGLIVFAGVVTPRMSVDTFPELTPPVLIIGTLCPGLAAKDVEKTISWRLEKYVSATPGVDHVESLSRNNFSVIYVWLKWGTDLNGAQTLVQSQAGFAMAAVPKSLGVLPPFVLQYDPSNAPVVQVVVTGEGYTGPQLYDYAFNNIEPLLEGIPGVASAAPDGGRLRQINVVVDPLKAQARNLTALDVSRAVSASNALLPSGEFIAPKFDANVYTNGVPREVKTIGQATVKVVHGAPVLIRDVADVQDSGTPETQIVSVNGKDAVLLNVLRVPGGNTIDIVDAVKKVVENLRDLPHGMQAKVYFDQSLFVRTTYYGLKKEIVQALVLIAIVILIFLQSLRGTMIVSVAIPLSFAITLIVLYGTGQTLNAFTLGGLTLAMGRLVDDAVVVLESIHRHQREGMGTAEAALEGTNAVALPVLASTLTTMAVLLPVVLLAGLARKLFAPLAITVGVAMMASYFVSMAVTPVACRYFLGHTEHGRFGKTVEGFIDRTADGYSRTLRTVLPYRAVVIAASLALVVGAGWTASRLPSTFFPEIDESM